MSSSPLISIITPVYNVECYLSQCINSIIAQTFQSWELILIDDGSIDGSGEICDEYAQKDSRIRVIHKNNTGQADSRNIALSIARAELVGFVDSDDWIEPDMYSILYNILMDNQVDIAICGYFLDYKDSSIASCEKNEIVIFDKQEALNLIWEDKIIKSFPCDKLFRRNVITHMFPKSYFYEDYATLFKWFMEAKRIALIACPKYHYRQRKNSTSNDGDPKKNFHFFTAEFERYSCLDKIDFFSDNRGECKLIKVGLKEAKDIAKYAKSNRLAMKYILKIRDKLNELKPLSSFDTTRKDYLKIWKLLNFPSYFYYETRLRYKCKFWKKNKIKSYY